ncbi:MAG: alpha-2-macroglobulin family protein [Fermentimonas sp.]|jgi:hypothetical protein
MNKITLTLLIYMLSFAIFPQANRPSKYDSYEKLWEEVADFEQKSLPKSASDKVDEILRLAVEEKNSPQTIKALIHQGKYDLALDAENDTLIFHNLNDMLAQSHDAVERALLHSMLGELYLQYYQKDRWNIDQRTELGDFVPDDMKEWTRGILLNRVVGHLNSSLEARDELLAATLESYVAIVELGNDSRRFFPTMYDFLARRSVTCCQQMWCNDGDISRLLALKGITMEELFLHAEQFVSLPFEPYPGEYEVWALELYRQHMASLLERKMEVSVLLTELEKLDYLARFQSYYKTHALPSLRRLLDKWGGNEMSVEIIDKIANFYRSEVNWMDRQDREGRERKNGELYEMLQEAVRAYPNYERIALLENQLQTLTQSGFTVSGNRTFRPGSEVKLDVTFKNLRSMTAKLYRVNSPKEVLMVQQGNRKNFEGQRRFVKDIPVQLPESEPYTDNEASIRFQLKEPGSYVLTFHTSPEKERASLPEYFFSVSNLAIFSRASGEDRYDFFVVNRVTGELVTDARVVVYKLSGNWRNSTLTQVTSLPVNRLGLAVYNKEVPNNDLFYHAVAGDDNGLFLHRLPYTYQWQRAEEEGERLTTSIFTDREIYRPGQTVFYKAVLTRENEEGTRAVSGQLIEPTLYDANDRKLSKHQATTNEYGSVSGEFTLPRGLLPGYFRIESERGSTHFKVEEYKRPTFEVSFDKIDEAYAFNKPVTLKGKVESFSGIKLQNTMVTYRVNRRSLAWWARGGGSELFAEGAVQTDDEGRFEISFTPQRPDNRLSVRSFCAFVVDVSVTDLNGETQTGSYTVSVGDALLYLSLEMGDRWEKDSGEKVVISAKNLDGNEVPATGSYRVYSLHENDSLHQLMTEGLFETGEQAELAKRLATLPSGKYRVKLEAKDQQGNHVEAGKDVILFSYIDRRPPIQTDNWFVEKNRDFAPGKPAEVILGATSRLNVLYELWQENNLLDRRWVALNNENKRFVIPYNEEYKEGVTLMLAYFKDEKFYNHQSDLRLVKESKKLSVKLSVFRDKILPGSEEEWRVTVTDAAGNPAVVELLASMYDFSLDDIYPTSPWSFPYFFRGLYHSMMQLSSDHAYNQMSIRGFYPFSTKNVPRFNYDQFNWFGYSLPRAQFWIRGVRSSNAGAADVQKLQLQVADMDLMPAANVDDLEETVVVGYGTAKREASPTPAPVPKMMGEGAGSDIPQVRRNFNETAFFYPTLRTNEEGEAVIAFTVPESNTRWRFRVLAHDKRANSGSAEAFAVSRKELMVTPNMPRFLRFGDQTSISTKVSNLSDSTLQGSVTLEFFDPATGEAVEIASLTTASLPFSLAPNASTDASWMFTVPNDRDILGIRIVAMSERFSDGEQHALALLPNRALTTETTRMDVRKGETKTFTMDRLLQGASPTRQDYRLTLEFASNPAWYAVQALPVLQEPNNESAIAWFASYYGASMGAHIARAYPKVTAMVEAWKKQGGDEGTLLSNLEKKQELKSVLLEETPWVLEARNESEQKEKLAWLFDVNRGRYLIRTAVDRLQELQSNQGGWSWFKGFPPSVGITHYILYGFQQLKCLGAGELTDDVRVMQGRAVDYIDAEALRRFQALKQYNKEWEKMKTISRVDLEYLFVRSAYGEYPRDDEARAMADFYWSVLKENWTRHGLYERALISLLMSREGDNMTARAIVDSFREHATRSDELGMYWADNRAWVFMSSSAVTVHTFIMDAFREVGAEANEMDEMKRWLLKQKQTQLWESTHGTMDAVYALLSTGSDWFASTGETVIHLGDLPVEAASKELGTGYVKESWSRTEIQPEMGRATVTHHGDTPAWGALYWQYFEEMDRIVKTDGTLDIEKQLFVEEIDPSGVRLVRITEERPLTVGDKVVIRLSLRSDRDLEYVHLKDTRAVCFEPANQLSGCEWQDGVLYYKTPKDASTDFYFNVLPKGTYVFEYAVHVNREGSYSNGMAVVQCMYAPEFTSRTAGERINVKE